jgi:hypothetical protein
MKTYIFLIALFSVASLASGEIPDVGIANPQDDDQIKIYYAGGIFLIRAVDLDIRMADQNLSKTPLGPAFSLFCDEK